MGAPSRHNPALYIMKPNGGNTPQAWFRRSRKRGPKGNALSECHSLHIQIFQSSLKFYERVAASAPSLGKSVIKPTRRRASVDLSHDSCCCFGTGQPLQRRDADKRPANEAEYLSPDCRGNRLVGHAVDQRVTGQGGGRGEDQRHDETQDRRPQRGKQNRKHAAAAAAMTPMTPAPIGPVPV